VSLNILDTIVAEKRREIALLPRRTVTVGDVRQVVEARRDRRDFLGALKTPPRPGLALIAEVKKASPSAGIIRAEFDPAAIAREYAAAGAACLSVLTDEKFFQGSADHLRQARAACALPVLRKDFIIDERQVLEAAEMGADAVLLIVRLLSEGELRLLHGLATGGGLAALVEVHDEGEMDRAVALGAPLIGVNNRDLDTLKIDLRTTERLAARAPRGSTLLVAESGLHRREDVQQAQRAGAGAILVGEALLKNPAGIATAVSQLLTGN
jgi:indole-3-glycerol phosphate synthase